MRTLDLDIHPEVIRKLSSEDSKLWLAAHEDGSDNRINGDTILQASGYATEFGVIAAVSQGIRKLFRNRNKTWQDLEAEKEAYRINNTCGALKVMLLEYIQAAQDGLPADPESLDELIDTLEEMHGYDQEGKLVIPGKKELSEIRKSIAAYTAPMTGNDIGRLAPEDKDPNADEFLLIREQLLKQKQWSGNFA